MKDNKEKKVNVMMASINPYIQDNILKLTEKEVNGKPFIEYGDLNRYPHYLYNLYRNVPTLQSIINGLGDYIIGDAVNINDPLFSVKCNRDGDCIEDIVKNIALDYGIYGGFALNIIRNKVGKICEIYYLDFKNIRSDKKNNMFFYSEDWDKTTYGRVKYLQYPAFDPEATDVPNSIFYFKNNKNGTYPFPLWGSSTISAELCKGISEYHLNNLKNGLTANVIINFNNGVPDDEVKEEIEDSINEKFCGAENSGRPMITFNADKDHTLTVEKIDVDNYVDRYKTLQEWARQELFTSFRANPSLFGIATEGSQINKEDYNEAYKLFNRTIVRPMQKQICNAFKKIFGNDVLIIEPFTIDFEEGSTNDETVES